MGRPPLGRAARSKTASVKLSAIEEEQLIANYGSVYAGMRAGVRLALANPQPVKKSGDKPKAKAAEKPVQEKPSEHRHKRGKVLREEYVQGSPVKVYECAVEGCGKEMR